MKKIDIFENIAVVLCVVASCLVSFYASDANFVLVFSLFSFSALILAVTTAMKKQYAIMRLQIFFTAINTFAIVKEII